MQPPFEVYPYSAAQLIGLITDKSGGDQHCVSHKLHSTYFEEYFSEIGAKTILVENRYIDKDFLEDFAGYYVRCFRDYDRRCTRIHFFRAPFNYEGFASYLSGVPTPITAAKLQEAYLGFLVVKPLPKTPIGRTCLRTYPHDGRRFFPITRNYELSLYGIHLQVLGTLAFQEQDNVVAACATSALWSVFQGTGKLFHHPIPSPVGITKAATDQIPADSRNLPNKGLYYISNECQISAFQLPMISKFSVSSVRSCGTYASSLAKNCRQASLYFSNVS